MMRRFLLPGICPISNLMIVKWNTEQHWHCNDQSTYNQRKKILHISEVCLIDQIFIPIIRKPSLYSLVTSSSFFSCLPPLERSLDSIGRSRQESLSSVEEDDYDTLDEIESDKNIVRTKVRLRELSGTPWHKILLIRQNIHSRMNFIQIAGQGHSLIKHNY